MDKSQSELDEPISVLTVADLEAIIVKIVQKVLKQETDKREHRDLQEVETVQASHPLKAFLETFGTWEDTRTAEEIIDDIYGSRTLPDAKDSL